VPKSDLWFTIIKIGDTQLRPGTNQIVGGMSRFRIGEKTDRSAYSASGVKDVVGDKAGQSLEAI
jgi:hypothetical protein